MNRSKYLLLLIFSFTFNIGFGQKISIHPTPKIDSVWYKNVTEDSEPEPLTCEENGIGYFRLKFESEIVVEEFKKDTIKTKKEDWEKEDEEAFDEEYNKEKKDELEELENHFIEEDVDIASQAQEEIDRFIDVNWNGYTYNICNPDCESLIQQCYIYHEITQLKDYKKTYKYRTSDSWLEIYEEGDNEVEIELDLVITYDTWIYFFVTCSCDEIPDLMSVPSKQMKPSNPWVHIDLLGEKMKPGYPFTSASKSFPILPVIGGIAAGGGLIYLLTQDHDNDRCNFTSTSQINHTKCGDLSGRAEIILTPLGDYIFEWSTGQNTSSINNVEAGNYSVTVTPKGQECPKVISVIINDEVDEIINTISTTDSDCGLSNGAAVIDNPSSDQSYIWSNGNIGFSAVDLAPGNYSVTATKGTCTIISEFTILENDAAFEATGDMVQPSCGQADGSISISVIPQGNYDYQWSTGDSGSAISTLNQGNYLVTISDVETNCSIIKEFSLEDLPADFTLTFTSIDATCGVPDGSISVEVDESGSYAYQWSNGESTQSIAELPAGNYEVTVTLIDSECIVVGNSTIEEKPFPLNIEFITTSPNCGLSDGDIELLLAPEGNYTFEWSDGQTDQNILYLSEGEYSVIITDQNGCTASGSTSLEDEPINYIEQIATSPGDCANGGEITLTITTPGDGPIVTGINGPNGQETFSLNSGTHDLSTLTELPPGAYSIEVYDQNAGADCNQLLDVFIEDNTPDILALDDNYETGAGESISGNVLENDEGLNILVNSFFDVNGGTTTLNSDGLFQFIPVDDFEGEASFNYIIEDACGSMDTALVIILVSQANCTFSAQFEVEAASCGLEDGSASATVDLPGNYSYQWSDGNTGSLLSNVSTGTYSLTITEVDLGCDLIFEVFIPENDPSYVNNLNVVQPFCSTAGDVLFDLNSPTPGPFIATISHPNGIDAFVMPGGSTILSDYIPIISGNYTISIYDSNAGPSCTETFTAFIDEAVGLSIALIEIIPPSSMTANDGGAIIEILNPSDPPYTVWVNGVEWDVVTEIEFIVSELGVGEYSIYITDMAGCTSNVVAFVISSPVIAEIDVSIGIITSVYSPYEHSDQTTFLQNSFIAVSSHLQYLGMNSTTSLKWISPINDSRHSLTHLFSLGSLNLGKSNFTLKGGGIINHSIGVLNDPSWAIELNGKIDLKGPFNLEVFVLKTGQAIEFLGIGVKLSCMMDRRVWNKLNILKK